MIKLANRPVCLGLRHASYPFFEALVICATKDFHDYIIGQSEESRVDFSDGGWGGEGEGTSLKIPNLLPSVADFNNLYG